MVKKIKVATGIPRVEYKKILYTADLSETGRCAFPYAASIANRYSAKLTVFHVVETLEFEKHLVGYIGEDLWDEIKTRNLKEAREILSGRKRDDATIRDAVDQFCQDAIGEEEDQPYVSYDIVVKTGEPVEEILKEAHGKNYDLIVIGEHSRRKIKRAMKRKVGSTAWRILHRCKIPIMVVRVPEEGEC
ncbi:MAG: universal stress protein [Pseudomonadota bacterium]